MTEDEKEEWVIWFKVIKLFIGIVIFLYWLDGGFD